VKRIKYGFFFLCWLCFSINGFNLLEESLHFGVLIVEVSFFLSLISFYHYFGRCLYNGQEDENIREENCERGTGRLAWLKKDETE
jgi:hypothetical protein